LFYFFFSSRRRHTRWPRDWSSDVCSSDLGETRTSHDHVSIWQGERIVPAGGDDACCDVRRAVRRRKELIALSGLPEIGLNIGQHLGLYPRTLAGGRDRRWRVISAQIACHHFLRVGNKEEGQIVAVIEHPETRPKNGLAVRGIGQANAGLPSLVVHIDVV